MTTWATSFFPLNLISYLHKKGFKQDRNHDLILLRITVRKMTNISNARKVVEVRVNQSPRSGFGDSRHFQSKSTSFCVHIAPSDSMRSEVLQNHVYSALLRTSDIPSAPLRPPQGMSYSEYCGQPCEVETIVGLPLRCLLASVRLRDQHLEVDGPELELHPSLSGSLFPKLTWKC